MIAHHHHHHHQHDDDHFSLFLCHISKTCLAVCWGPARPGRPDTGCAEQKIDSIQLLFALEFECHLASIIAIIIVIIIAIHQQSEPIQPVPPYTALASPRHEEKRCYVYSNWRNKLPAE